MPAFRHLEEDDLGAMADLFWRVYPQYHWSSKEAFTAYCRDMLFANPWRDLDLPSLVAEENGRMVGLVAVLPRSMQFNGRTIRVAVPCQFMVDPEKRNSLIALQLLKRVAAGPQDLTFADGANDAARRMWVGLGGMAPPLYNLTWTRPLRPARLALSMVEERMPAYRPATMLARPLAAAADAVADRFGARKAKNAKPRGGEDLIDEDIDSAALHGHLPEVTNGHALRPNYDRPTFEWLIDQTSRKARHGKLRMRAVRDSKQLLGGYIYYAKPGTVCEVVHVYSRHGAYDRVLGRLLADARDQGALALRGRAEPEHVTELSEQRCWFRHQAPSALVHSRHPEVTSAIRQGDAIMGRLEGEWWLRFQGG